MNGILSYIKRAGGWLAVIVVCELVMIITMILNKISFGEIGYGILVSLFSLLVFMGIDALKYYRHYQKVKELEHTVIVSTDGMPETSDPVEMEYQTLLRILSAEYSGAQSREYARQKDMQEYYAMWVHQVKTPIAALRLLLQNKNDEGQMAEELSELFGIEQYVEMALQYQRLDAESTDFVFAETSLDEVIRASVRKYARQFIAKKISLVYEPVQTTVITDKKWLSFVIEQVLSNAIKYTKTGSIKIYLENGNGTMSVPEQKTYQGKQDEAMSVPEQKTYQGKQDETMSVSEQKIYQGKQDETMSASVQDISHAKEDRGKNNSAKSVCLVIEDTGIGIRAEDLPRICEMGYTGCNGHEGQHSSGIGLYLCSRILKKLGHSFSITSKEGTGTVVKIG